MRQSLQGLVLVCALLGFAASPGHATPLVRARTATKVDWVSAGIGGTPDATAHIAVTGATGPVTKAYLYWDGMNLGGATTRYDNPTITFAGHTVTGTSMGDSSSNCWGSGSTRAYVADVTSWVTG